MKLVSRWSVALVAVAGLMLVSCSDKKPKPSGCKTNEDCDAGEVCDDNGTCVARTTVGTCEICAVNEDCNGGNICAAVDPTRSACVPPCDVAAPDCPIDFYCAEGACIPSGGSCCVDEDGDGVGSGVDCTAMDCDDTNEHCTNDCTDADGDGWCVGHDCDDNLAHCDVDCTDTDSDDWCLGHDCNDNDGAQTDVCVYCDTDADGDGYGEGDGCLGTDCDDLNPHCYSGTTCTDTDGDGWCDETDCDHDNEHCDGDCTDADGDGWCAAYDCDDGNAHCTDSCADQDRDDWCVGHDCDDTDPHCWVQDIGGVCTVDGDGDGWCDEADCEPGNANCYEPPCTDVDNDDWCAETDCDDSLVNCNADCSSGPCGGCTDNDHDGYGPGCANGSDCDDTLEYCNISPCTDADDDGYCLANAQSVPDCDDTRDYVYPGGLELCDGLNNDCSGAADVDGDVPTMCPNMANVFTTECGTTPDANGDLCGILQCSGGGRYHDVNGLYDDGCECEALPNDVFGDTSKTCDNAIVVKATDGNDFIDNVSATAQVVGGTIPARTRIINGAAKDYVIWYTFLAVDDDSNEITATVDRFAVTVDLIGNPGNQFEFEVWRAEGSGCNTCGCAARLTNDAGGDYGDLLEWDLDYNSHNGQCNPADCDGCSGTSCPDTNMCCCGCCVASNPYTTAVGSEGCRGSLGISTCQAFPRCTNHTARFFVGVRRKASAAVTCDEFQLSIENGQ